MLPFQKRITLSRSLLILGLLLVIAAHFLPLETTWFNPPEPGLPRDGYLEIYWISIWGIARDPAAAGLRECQSAFIITGIAALVVALPFLAGLLSRARALRWLAIILLLAATAAFVGYIAFKWGNLAASGSHVLIAGLWLSLLGLLLLPDARPGATLCWKAPLTLALILAFLFASPRIFRAQADRLFAENRLERCLYGLRDAERCLYDFEGTAGRLPTPEEGWQPLITRPANWPQTLPSSCCDGEMTVEPWHPFISRAPLDPWGGDYQYALDENGNPELSSKGPDGLLGTADDIQSP